VKGHGKVTGGTLPIANSGSVRTPVPGFYRAITVNKTSKRKNNCWHRKPKNQKEKALEDGIRILGKQVKKAAGKSTYCLFSGPNCALIPKMLQTVV
jgi:hypothetical protein